MTTTPALPSFQHTPSCPVVFGVGAAATVGDKTLLKKHERVLVVTDVAVRGAGLCDAALAGLGARAVIVDDGVVPDGDVAHVEALAARAKDQGVTAVLAIGGGSVIDSAKGVGAVIATGKTLAELEGVAKVRAKVLPIVAVPTTSGTGSEATQFAVIKDKGAGAKRIIVDASVIPALAVLDPSLLVGLPASVTKATATDAVTHALEALVSRMANPIGHALATEALRLMLGERALARALAAPDDVAARADCLVAAHLAGGAVNTSMLGACHALAHPLGAMAGVPHGIANGLFLEPVLLANAAKVAGRYAALGPVIGVAADASAVMDAVAAFVHDTASVPRRLRDVGVAEATLPALAAAAAADPDLPTNPVRLDEAALMTILRARW